MPQLTVGTSPAKRSLTASSELTASSGPSGLSGTLVTVVTLVTLGNPNKLSRPEEYKAALAAPCRLSGKNFLVRALSNSWLTARLGLISSRKAAPRSVDRNRCKRLAREAFRAAKAQLPAVDIVFQQKNDLRKSGNAAIRQELDQLLQAVAARFGSGKHCVTPPAPDVL